MGLTCRTHTGCARKRPQATSEATIAFALAEQRPGCTELHGLGGPLLRADDDEDVEVYQESGTRLVERAFPSPG